jgi:hypothetical protein
MGPPRISIRGAIAAGALAALFVGGGCELVVGDTLPAFECGGGPDTCPPDKVCNPRTRSCVAPCTSASCASIGMQCDTGSFLCVTMDVSVVPPMHDASVSSDAGEDAVVVVEVGPPDVGSYVDVSEAMSTMEAGDATSGDASTCRGLTCPCSGPAACDSGICAEMLTEGAGLYAKLMGSFCTQPCCTSADCTGGTVCYSNGAGAAFCVRPEWVGRSTTPGSAIGGSPCTADSACQSGLCDATSHTCADTCCSTVDTANQCAGSTVCTFGDFPGLVSFDQGMVAYCGQGGTRLDGDACTFPQQCRSNFCDGDGYCRDACRNSRECGNGFVCMYARQGPPNMEVIAACAVAGGNGALGDACSSSQDCFTGLCIAPSPSDPTTKRCTDVCFTDADCSYPGWRCGPHSATLRSGGATSVMCCGT